jgi:hypothetical protein
MSENTTSDSLGVVLSIIYKIGWLIFAVFVFVYLYDPIVNLVPHIESFKGGGVEVKFAQEVKSFKENLKEDVELRSEGAKDFLSDVELRALSERAIQLKYKLFGTRVLWVDDNHPLQNSYERQAFQSIGIFVDIVSSSEQVLIALTAPKQKYDILITDMGRKENGKYDSEAGKKLLATIQDKKIIIPTLIYSYSFSPKNGIPDNVFGVATRRDRLVQFVFDIVELKPK